MLVCRYLAEPEFIDMETAFRINLYRVANGSSVHEETDEETSEEIDICSRILAEIRNAPFITQKQLAVKVGLSYSGIRYIMKQLQDKGLLKRVGSTKKGQWIPKSERQGESTNEIQFQNTAIPDRCC